MRMTALPLLASMIGLLLSTGPVFAAGNGNAISASASIAIAIAVQILPGEMINPRLSSTEMQPGVESQGCLNAFSQNNLDPGAFDTSDRTLARNFLCNTTISEYKLVESNDVVTLRAIPV